MTDGETKAFALIGQALSYGLIARLMNKGILSPAEVQSMFDGALQTFEELPDDEVHRAVRVILDDMAKVASHHSAARGE